MDCYSTVTRANLSLAVASCAIWINTTRSPPYYIPHSELRHSRCQFRLGSSLHHRMKALVIQHIERVMCIRNSLFEMLPRQVPDIQERILQSQSSAQV